MDRDPFKEYIKQSEPDKRDKGYAWHIAIGLQAVDGLETSKYLKDTAIQNIEGEITIEEAQELLDRYLLSEKAFSFTPNEYISIHKKLFQEIYAHAGKIRDYNITKKEWVLDGATVIYGSASELRATLEYDFLQKEIQELPQCFSLSISECWVLI